MPSVVSGGNVIQLSKKRGSRTKGAAFPFIPDRVFVDRSIADHPNTLRIISNLGHAEVDVVDDARLLKHPTDAAQAKRRMILTAHRGGVFNQCQAANKGQLCCGYRTIDLVSGCPMECSYCLLQSRLKNDPVTKIYVNLEDILEEVSEFLSCHPDRFFRIGTGELSDSLAFDPLTDFARILIPFFASKRNALLELKTKTAYVDQLLELNHRNRTVISWPVGIPSIIASEERGTASLDERIEAARKASAAGYGIGFHLDPVIITNEPEGDVLQYLELIDRLMAEIPASSISWVSLGLLRYPDGLPRAAMKSFPETRIFTGELVPLGGMFRYPRFIREKVYRPLWNRLCEHLPPHKLYLCMETDSVWGRIDPSVKSSGCIEKRLCHTEILHPGK